MTKLKRTAIKIMAFVGVTSFIASFCVNSFLPIKDSVVVDAASAITKVDTSIKTNQEKYYDSNVIYQLPETVSQTQDISVIVKMSTDTLLDVYSESDTSKTLSEYVNSTDARLVASSIARERKKLVNKLDKSGVNYVMGEEYDTILSGFEITIKAKDFDKVSNLFASNATLIVGETYEPAESQIVTNDVDVYNTGIFDTSSAEYQGDGVVVAVLDSGLDYTHSAFSVDNFTTSNEAFTLANVSAKVSQTVASTFTSGLTGEDVYLNKKIPFAYDYADKDADVLPTNSDHGTHVSGIIAGKDDTITGVAPNAQLAFMKVFSDSAEGAKTSWLLAALEDCVTLGVDVVNMSLGSGCGFAREVDEENVNEVYDSIRDAGISLVVSAGNAYNSAFGSEKNGNLGLTSNPDTGTVGSPSTYAASLSVASVDGVKTPYLLYNGEIIYFNEASTSSAKTKDFVDDILKTLGDNVQSHDFEYVTIPGIGRSSDYPQEASFYEGKIVLVKRGTTSFEDKVRVALKEKGAAGIIIYNNVSGPISMAVGADVGAVCSITQDEGEMLAAAETGIIRISRSQVAGPFMSDFSSWGPTSDLQIKPEITAHGGEILSAIPGQAYDVQSGTSMAAPNQSGATALIRQYVKYSGIFGSDLTTNEITARVNQLMMSTTDIIYNKNGLPYAVRKQGSGLVNINKAFTSSAYLTTFDKNGDTMDKTKLELGDDKEKTGVYEMTFAIHNISGAAVSYDVDSILLTEGVSKTYTSHSDTTVTQDGYLLTDSTTTVTAVSGNGTQSGNKVTVAANQSATVTVKIVLSEKDKKYMDDSFAHGMYVEGFVTLDGNAGIVDLNVPMLAFYGDWTEAPIFDEEYYDTNVDELNAGLNPEDKLMADGYATRAIGGLYSDYIATLGSYFFEQDPAATQIAANKEHIALSNQQAGEGSSINTLSTIWAGFLRNVKEANITITEDSTGKEVFNRTEYNLRKSFGNGGSTIFQSSIDVEFGALEYNLKNNTKYTVKVTTYIDYGSHEEQSNARNVFEFPLYIDFEAPIVTDVVYRTEYDRTTKKTKLFADLSVYDNHYAMGMQIGQIVPADPSTGYAFSINSFGKYVTPVYSSYNSTSKVTIELTDYISELKQSAGLSYDENGNVSIKYNNNSFIATCYDYALNSAMYEIRLPDEVLSMYFTEESVSLSPNETKELSTILNIYPSDSWLETLDFSTSDKDVVEVVNQTILAKQSGTATITATGYDKAGNVVTASLDVKVLAEGEEGYVPGYTVPEVNKFTITGYKTNKAYYGLSSEDREIGITDGEYDFAGTYTLSMFPSESVTLQYTLDSYFPDRTAVTYKVGNSKIATVSEDGTIVAQAEGNTIVNVNVTFDGQTTLYSGRVNITVKDPFIINSIYLTSYKGLGGEVVIPDDRGITTIQSYAFANYEYVEKDLAAGDVIDDEDPYNLKQMYLGEDTIQKVVIPEGVTTIEAYAFAKLTALEEVVLPSTLTRIGVGAFLGCEKLKTINLEHVKFINEEAFLNCALEEVDLSSIVAISNYAFRNCKLNYAVLPESAQSIGIGAFYDNKYLTSVEFKASKIKIGSQAFVGCTQLQEISINAAVIASYAFADCEALTKVHLGKDVAVIGEYAFAGTKVASFTKDYRNTALTLEANGALILKGNELICSAPAGISGTVTTNATSIGTGAFAGNTKIFQVNAPEATSVGAYAFADCTNLQAVSLPKVTSIGDYAFTATALTATPALTNVKNVGKFAFAYTDITSVTLAENTQVGEYAFAYCTALTNVSVGNGSNIGAYAFHVPVYALLVDINDEATYGNLQYYTLYNYEVKDEDGNVMETLSYYRYDINAGALSTLKSVSIGDNVVLGSFAFDGNTRLATLTLGDGVAVGEGAFYNNVALTDVDLGGVKSIGAYAFSGVVVNDIWQYNNNKSYAYEMGYQDGEPYIVDYMYTGFAPAIKEIDLLGLEAVDEESLKKGEYSLGEGAFAYNRALEKVELSPNLTVIAAGTFMRCSSLAEIILPATVTSVGAQAFYGTALKQLDLSNVSSIGASAFAATDLAEVTLKEGVEIDSSAFNYCFELGTVNNLDKVKTIGAYAFSNTALTELTLMNVTSIGDYAFSNSAVQSVTFGDKLESLGENPFFGCWIETFGKQSDVTFNDATIGTELLETYDVSATVKVIDGILYQSVPNGLELISYPLAKADTTYVVEEGTVRISARAFAYTVLQNVTLPSTLKALGDKAFYGCYDLAVIIFKGYTAPILEEEYDLSYATAENLPIPGYMGGYKGLGISDYYMWNVETNYNNYYFGANFVDYIGHVDGSLVMVKPANGQNYDTFILSQYFGTTVQGVNAATETTLNVIAMIAALPENVTLADEAVVVAAREAYNKIPSVEQQALVSNYDKLTAAESTLEYLKLRDQTPEGPSEEPIETDSAFVKFLKNNYVAIIITSVAVLGAAAYIIVNEVLKRKKANVNADTEADGVSVADSAESDNNNENN